MEGWAMPFWQRTSLLCWEGQVGVVGEFEEGE